MTERTTTDASSGWYPDPWKPGQQRYWDGQRWTSDVFQHAFDLTASPQQPAALGPAPTAPAAFPPPPPDFGSRAPAAAPLPPWTPPAEVLASPEPHRNRALIVTAALVAAVLVLAGLAVAAFRPTDRSTAAPTPPPMPSPTAPAQPRPTPTPSSPAPSPSAPTQPPGAHAALLANLVVRQQDVPAGYTVGTISGGDQVQGEATLDLCDATYPSEALRLERLQTAAIDPQQVAGLSTEAVLYGSAAATAQAFREVAEVAKTCPTTGTTDPVTGATSTTTFGPAPGKDWPRTPGVDRQAYTVTTTSDTGTSRTSTVVYLKRGPVLLGVYFLDASTKPVPVEGKTTVPAIVKLFEKRLLNPPTNASGGSTGSPGVTA